MVVSVVVIYAYYIATTTVHHTMYTAMNVMCILHGEGRTLYSVQCTVYGVHYVLRTMNVNSYIYVNMYKYLLISISIYYCIYIV